LLVTVISLAQDIGETALELFQRSGCTLGYRGTTLDIIEELVRYHVAFVWCPVMQDKLHRERR
jgi:hypothetical protein